MARSTTALSKPDIYRQITDRIVAAVEANPANPTMPWHRSGLSTVMPTNAATGNSYRGINVVSLWADAQIRGFPFAVWASFKQWQSIGAQVRRGEKSALVVFYTDYQVDPDPQRPEDDGKRKVAKASHVFNCAQVDGYTPAEPPPPLPPLAKCAAAETFLAATGATIVIGGETACYRPSTDTIHMPDEDRFRNPDTAGRTDDWYAVTSHELAHWSGAATRLKREFGKRFGDNAYCVEEIVAELTSCFVMTRLGMAAAPRADHAQYIGHFIRLMKSDSRAVFAAAAKAAEATDYLFGLAGERLVEPSGRDA